MVSYHSVLVSKTTFRIELKHYYIVTYEFIQSGKQITGAGIKSEQQGDENQLQDAVFHEPSGLNAFAKTTRREIIVLV
jgi:hypothetical protein